MAVVDKDKFLFLYQEKEFKPLSDTAHEGLMEVLGFLESDEYMTDIRWIAYALATVFHECAGKWKPIEEFGKGKGEKYGQPEPPYQHVYYGRGYVQLTWKGNYATISEVWNKAHPERPIDLVRNPELMLVPEYSYFAMSTGMRRGRFTGARLEQYFNDEKTDPVNARRIINGTDCAEKIASYYEKFYNMLKEATI